MTLEELIALVPENGTSLVRAVQGFDELCRELDLAPVVAFVAIAVAAEQRGLFSPEGAVGGIAEQVQRSIGASGRPH